MALITCKDLSLGYDGKSIISGLNFTIGSGDYFCIIGENGSGKSTQLSILNEWLSATVNDVIFTEWN